MSVSTMISVGWPKPTGLKVIKEKDGLKGNKATFSWNKISDASMVALDPSGGGYFNIFWRVMINEQQTYLVYNNPVFSISIPLGCCKLCVKVQTVFDLSNVAYTYGDIVASEFCDEVCVNCDPDPYCENPRFKNQTVTQNKGSANMRYARAVSVGGANAFR